MAVTRKEQADALDKAVKQFEDTLETHGQLMRKVDRRSDAYHAIMDKQKDKGWRSQLYAPYAMHIVDSTLASMVDDRLRFKVKPRVQMYDLEEDPVAAAAKAKQGAEAHQILFDWQIRQTKFTRIQRPFLLQNAIAGITVAKTFWTERAERRRRMVSKTETLTDDNGQPIVDPYTGQPLTYETLREEMRTLTVYDGPDTEVVDVHDFFWPKNARELSTARYVCHRIWVDSEHIDKEYEDGGQYGPDHGGWTKRKVDQVLGTSRDATDSSGQRWSQQGETTYDKDKVEVVEVWDRWTRKVTTFANRSALLSYKDFPFFHEDVPFVVCTTQADLFQVVGISQMEKLEALQTMLWNLSNQRMDNVELINNAIVLFNPALEDADALEWFPGAMWPMEDPEMVKMLDIKPMPAEVSLGTEALLKGDMQNLAGGFPFASGTESQTVDQKTATGASIISSLAQRSIDLQKQPVYQAMEDIGNQRLILNNQFIREPTAASVLGLDGEEDVKVIMPEMLEGDYEFVLEPMPDQALQQEKQAQAQSMVQVLGGIAPILAPLAQAGLARMVNFDEVIKFYLQSIGIEETDSFFVSKTPPALGNAGGGQANPAQGDGTPPLGITGPGSIDPSVSPGAQMSSAPSTNLQRAQALAGGVLGG